MKKLIKVGIVVALLVAVVIGIASVVLHVVLPPEKAKAMILKQLTGRLHREVSVGAVSVGVLSGVRLADLKVSESPELQQRDVSRERCVFTPCRAHAVALPKNSRASGLAPSGSNGDSSDRWQNI